MYIRIVVCFVYLVNTQPLGLTKSLLRSTPFKCVFCNLNLRGAAPRLPFLPFGAGPEDGTDLAVLSTILVALKPSVMSVKDLKTYHSQDR